MAHKELGGFSVLHVIHVIPAARLILLFSLGRGEALEGARSDRSAFDWAFVQSACSPPWAKPPRGLHAQPLSAFAPWIQLATSRTDATFSHRRDRERDVSIGSSDLLQGTLQTLILKALLAGSAHGYGIARWIEETTDDILRVEEGSLYPALRRLEDKGYISSDWGLSDNNRRARYYLLTASGRA